MDMLEKAKLMREIGMQDAARKIEAEIEMKKEAERLAAMKFTPTTDERVKGQICKRYKLSEGEHRAEINRNIGVLGVSPVVLSIGVAVLWMTPLVNEAIVMTIALAVAAGFLNWKVRRLRFKTAELAFMPLSSWTDPIPYGALLAVKEAKAAGLGDFTIYYPVTERRARILADPVIVGYVQKEHDEMTESIIQEIFIGGRPKPRPPRGPMFEVFAWDDSKVYD